MSKEQAMTKKENALPSNMFEADAGQGIGNLTQEDLALPFLKILGQLSPEVNKRDGKYVEGAEPGMIYNSVTSELFDGEKGLNVIPCHYKLNTLNGETEAMAQELQLQFIHQAVISYHKQLEEQTSKIDYKMVIILRRQQVTL